MVSDAQFVHAVCGRCSKASIAAGAKLSDQAVDSYKLMQCCYVAHRGRFLDHVDRQSVLFFRSTRLRKRCLPTSLRLRAAGSAYQTLLPQVYSPVLYDAVLDARTLAVARASVDDSVQVGTLLGVVTNYFGEPMLELRSPARGTLLMLHDTPPVSAGETPATIAVME